MLGGNCDQAGLAQERATAAGGDQNRMLVDFSSRNNPAGKWIIGVVLDKKKPAAGFQGHAYARQTLHPFRWGNVVEYTQRHNKFVT